MIKPCCSSDETKRLREAEKRKKENRSAKRLAHYHNNKESINRKLREKRSEAKRLKAAAQQQVDNSNTASDSSCKPKKYDWALYKRNQRAKAKEELKKKEESKCTRNDSGTAFPTRMSKKRRVDLVKSHLPESPAKKLAVVATLIESPTTRKGLMRKGLISSAEKNDEAAVALLAMHDAREAINATKGGRSNDSRAATQTALGFLCGDKVKNNRMKTKVSKMLNINRKSVGRAYNHRKKVLKSEKSCWTYTEQQTRIDAIPAEHRKLAHDFWASPDISRTTPNKRDIVRKRLAPKIYVAHPKQILDKTQTEAYMEIKTKYPEIKMGQRVFESCKPFYIATPRSQDRVSCCCRVHVETRMLFQSCMEFRRQLDEQLPEEKYTVYKHVSDLVNEMLCPKKNGNEYHKPLCLQRNCENCGIDGFKISNKENDITETAPIVKWRKFEYVVIGVNSDNSEKKKLQLVDKLTPPGEMFLHFKNLLQRYPSHQFRANWQNQQLRELVENLPLGHAVAVHDYFENYTCSMQDQIQSLYFLQVQASIHITILHRHALLGIDGIESTEENPFVITEHIFVISSDCKHDHHSVHSVWKHMAGYLKKIGMKYRKAFLNRHSLNKQALLGMF